jgi:hypothetical protein
MERRDIITVDPMASADAVALLIKKVAEHNDQSTAIDLVTALEYMPLAIVQAAAYIVERASRYALGQYLEDYRKNDRKKASLLNCAD